MMEWLLLPLSGSAQHHIDAWAYWHARCMVAGWGVLLPLGALVARFYKVTPRQDWPRELDNKAWWHGHRTLQWAGVALVTLGVALAWGQGAAATKVAQWHAWAGWAVSIAVWLQIAGGFARGSKGGPTAEQLRGDHYDMTPWRLAFERLHKGLGWAAVLASVAVIALGLVAADAPRWMVLVLALWWAALAATFVRLQRAGRCIDTYQAIWGPAPAHPGNQRPPTGWGVRRPFG
jgi:Eukaryotic cytochrome b561